MEGWKTMKTMREKLCRMALGGMTADEVEATIKEVEEMERGKTLTDPEAVLMIVGLMASMVLGIKAVGYIGLWLLR